MGPGVSPDPAVVPLESKRSEADTRGMDRSDEVRAVAVVVDRLSAHFPEVPRAHVEAVVTEEHRRLDGNPIRDFVPVLVEHEARDRLRSGGATEAAGVLYEPPAP